jgi:hypothetical protein
MNEQAVQRLARNIGESPALQNACAKLIGQIIDGGILGLLDNIREQLPRIVGSAQAIELAANIFGGNDDVQS